MTSAKMEKKKITKRVRRVIPDDVQNKSIAVAIEKAQALLLTKEVEGQIIDKLAYSFPKKDKNGNEHSIDGLTFWGYKACAENARVNAWTPVFMKPEYTPLSNGKVILNVGVKNPKTKAVEYGNCVFDPNSRFDERTALTNAKRYALDKHISVPQRVAFIEYLKAYEPEKVLQITPKEVHAIKPKELTTSVTKTPDDAQKDIALKAVFAQVGNIKTKTGVNLDKEKVKQYFKNKSGAVSMRDLSVVELRQVWQELYTIGQDPKALAKFAKEIESVEVINEK